jgi:hypothetical protein
MDENECPPCAARAKAIRTAAQWIAVGTGVFIGLAIGRRVFGADDHA